MLFAPARRALARSETYVCPRCAVDRLAVPSSHRSRRLHFDAQPAEDDAFPAMSRASARESNTTPYDYEATTAGTETRPAVSRVVQRKRAGSARALRVKEMEVRKRYEKRSIAHRPLKSLVVSDSAPPETRTESLLQRLENARSSAMEALRDLRDSLTGRQNNARESPRLKSRAGSLKALSSKAPSPKTSSPKTLPSRTPSPKKHPAFAGGGLSGTNKLIPIDIEQPPPPRLTYGLDRVMFNPGVYRLQDARTGVYNFDPYLENIMPVHEFDFDALRKYRTSSKDDDLASIANQHGKKYIGSTSSMTTILSHMHFLISSWRPPNMSMLSANFPTPYKSYTNLSRAPAGGVLVWNKEKKLYALDASKEFSTPTVLSSLGLSMEKLLTLNTDEFEQYRKTGDGTPPKEVESFHYTTLGDFLFRSQLDACDPRLPGEGIFDVKTRAVVAVRMDSHNPQKGSGYEILTNQGEWESFEREYYDLIRAAFLKYSLQVRMGRMDGIFVAYHNTERIFGFQYIPLSEMDLALHGQTDLTLGDKEFKFSIALLNKLLDLAVARFPEQSLEVYFETRGTAEDPWMYFIAKPVSELEMEEMQRQDEEDASFVEAEEASTGHESLILPEERFDLDSDVHAPCDPSGAEVTVKNASDPDDLDHASDDLCEMDVVFTDVSEHEESLEHGANANVISVHLDSLESLEGAIDASLRESDNHGSTETEEHGSAETEEDDSPPEGHSSPAFDLMVLKVRVKHKELETPCPGPPNNFTASSPVWNMEYTCEQYVSPAAVQRVYQACKARRKNVLTRSKPWANAYLSKLRQMSIQGKKRRSEVEEKAAAKVVFSPNA